MTKVSELGLGPNHTLEEVALRISEELTRKAGADPDRWAQSYCSRRGWGSRKVTLDQISKHMGLSRARVYQVLRPVEVGSPLKLASLPEALVEVAGAIDWEDADQEVSSLIEDLGLSASAESWTPTALIDLIRSCGRTDIAAELDRRYETGLERKRLTPEIRKAVRSARSGLGVLDLRTVEVNGEILGVDEALLAVEMTYSTVIRVGNWTLCRGSKLSSLENAAIQQLQIAEVLSGHELVRGVFRNARRRRWVAPPEEITIELLREIGLLRSAEGGFTLVDTGASFEFGKNDDWLFQTLSAENPHALPYDELLRRARADGLKNSSINVHLTYSPIVRKSRGVAVLIGTQLTEDDIELLVRVGRAARVRSAISYRAHPDGVELELTMGTGYITTGVVSIRKDLVALIGNQRHRIRCCQGITFDVNLGLSGAGSNTWYGWSSLFQHWTEVHGLEEGQTVRMLMNAEEVACLEPWADSEKPTRGSVGEISSGTEPAVDEISKKSIHRDEDTDSNTIQASTTAPSSEERADEQGLPASPGERWPRSKGHRVLTLSLRQGDLLVPTRGSDTGRHAKKVALSDTGGTDRRKLAGEWLGIRPSGGRVWVDRNGDASTLVDNQLIYLGRIPSTWDW